jgi:hypothetical protein
LEGLDRQREVVQDFVLILKSESHFVFELFPKSQELCKRLLLESFDVLMLLIELAKSTIFKFSERKTLVRSFRINLLLQSVLGIVNCLHDIFLSLNPGGDLGVKTVLKLYKMLTHCE